MGSAKLLLFDIDGTLLDTGGAGGAALLDAAEEILNMRREDIPALDLAGATDRAVIRKLFNDAGAALEPDRVSAFQQAYLRCLNQRLTATTFPGRLLPGVDAMLGQVTADSRFCVGLLTGNLRRGADLKLERFAIHHHFADGGFGDDAELRNDIGPVAVRRMEAALGRLFLPQDTIVIGDTPRDIACAHAMGARCLAVATGKFSAPDLRGHASWQVFDDLSDAGAVIELLAA